MSNIPFAAIGAAFTPVQRSTNDLLRARKVQSDKDSHHTEDVEELDVTAVNSVNDRQQGGRRQKNPEARQGEESEEKVEIAALHETPPKAAARPGKLLSQLDISA
jgi:hypothetical protein